MILNVDENESAKGVASYCDPRAPATDCRQWPPTTDVFNLSECHPPNFDVELTLLKFLSQDDPAYFFVYEADASIHAACGIAGSPVLQGVDAADSAARLRAWVAARFGEISPNCRIPIRGGGFSEHAFERLSNVEAARLGYALTVNVAAWVTAMMAAGVRVGTCYIATPSPGGAAGGGRSPQVSIDPRFLLFY
jgi:hypothetical protein